MEKKGRTFRIVKVAKNDGVDFHDGVYRGKRPQQAALKAFNKYCNKANLQNCTRKFTIEEITRNSKNKRFSYTGCRRKLDTPKEIERSNGVGYSIKYHTTLTSLKE